MKKRFLLDTHALLWWLFDDPRLSETAHATVADRDHGVFVSSASAWEIATKHRLGKLDVASALVKDLAGFVAKAGFEPLSVSIAHAQKAGLWPQSHRDPFDRMLAAQAALEDMVLVTCDPALETFDVPRLW